MGVIRQSADNITFLSFLAAHVPRPQLPVSRVVTLIPVPVTTPLLRVGHPCLPLTMWDRSGSTRVYPRAVSPFQSPYFSPICRVPFDKVA